MDQTQTKYWSINWNDCYWVAPSIAKLGPLHYKYTEGKLIHAAMLKTFWSNSHDIMQLKTDRQTEWMVNESVKQLNIVQRHRVSLWANTVWWNGLVWGVATCTGSGTDGHDAAGLSTASTLGRRGAYESFRLRQRFAWVLSSHWPGQVVNHWIGRV